MKKVFLKILQNSESALNICLKFVVSLCNKTSCSKKSHHVVLLTIMIMQHYFRESSIVINIINCRETEYFYTIFKLITNFEPMIFSNACSPQL